MRIINLEQGSDLWLEFRRKHIQATDASIILGLNNFKDMHQLWLEKMGFIEPEPANEAMKRGQTLEPIARCLLYDELGINFEPMVVESDDYPWMGASLDGISLSHSVICEIKCMKLSKHLQVSKDTIDPCHYAQVQHQLECTNASYAIYASYHPEAEEKLIVIHIRHDQKFQKNMIEKEKEFYFETMCNMQPTRESWTFKEKVR